MKPRRIAAACLAFCSAAAWAQTEIVIRTSDPLSVTVVQTTAAEPVVCDKTTLIDMINTCAPEVTFYAGGAPVLFDAMNAALSADGAGVFDSTQVRGRIGLMSPGISGLNGLASSDITQSNTAGYIGLGAVGTLYAGKVVLVMYNRANGSFAGVNQLLNGRGGAGEELTLVTATKRNLAWGVRGTCTLVTDSVGGSLGAAACTTEASFRSAWGADAIPQKFMHLAVADLRPSEAAPGVVRRWDRVKFPAVSAAMQGFGVIVNPLLYTALIAKGVREGQLPASCETSETVGAATDIISAACQPNLSTALYASLVTLTGGITTADALLDSTGDTHKLVLARRADFSGTQAATNIFFAGQAGYNARTPLLDGYADIKPAGVYPAVVGDLTVVAGSSAADVIDKVASDVTDYAAGVVSLANFYRMSRVDSRLKGALFVRLEGQSPNFRTDGTLDDGHRVGLQNGYPFAYEVQTLKRADLTGDYLEIANKLVAAMVAPAHDLAGLAYIGSTDPGKNTSYTRGVSNYQPLVKN